MGDVYWPAPGDASVATTLTDAEKRRHGEEEKKEKKQKKKREREDSKGVMQAEDTDARLHADAVGGRDSCSEEQAKEKKKKKKKKKKKQRRRQVTHEPCLAPVPAAATTAQRTPHRTVVGCGGGAAFVVTVISVSCNFDPSLVCDRWSDTVGCHPSICRLPRKSNCAKGVLGVRREPALPTG